MADFDFRTDDQKLKTFVFLIKTAAQMRDKFVMKGELETAAEYQEQIKVLKASLFEILLNDKYTIDITDSGKVMVEKVKEL